MPDLAAEVFVKYNEAENGDADRRGDHRQDHHPREPVALPDRRVEAQRRPVHQRQRPRGLPEQPGSRAWIANCKKQGVEILAVAITRVEPPQDIAEPVRDREVAKQQLAQFNQEKMQQLSEAKLADRES